MGASVSKQNVEMINKTIVDVIVTASQNTNSYMEASQTMNISGFSLFFWQKQKAATSIAAIQEVQITNELIKEIAQKIAQEAEAKSAILTVSYAEANTKIENILQTSLTDETKQSCVSAMKAGQIGDISGTSIIAIQTQTVSALAECTQIKNISNTINEQIFQDVKGGAKSDADLLPFLTNTAPYIGIFIVFIILMVILGMVFKKPAAQPEPVEGSYDDILPTTPDL